MYYELYMDVFFLENFMMDYLILLTAGKILHCTATQWRIFLGAGLGSLLTCLGILLPGYNGLNAAFKWIWLYVLVNLSLAAAGLGIKKGRELLKAALVLYISSFLLGGVMGMAKPWFRRTGSLFFCMAAISYQLVRGSLKLLDHLRSLHDFRCSVTMYRNDSVYKVNALIDTGNRLHEPESGKPVHIVNRELAQKAWGSQPLGKVRYITFTTVGEEKGLIPVIAIDRMHIQGKKEFWVDSPLVGISSEKISGDGSYDMILSPDIF